MCDFLMVGFFVMTRNPLPLLNGFLQPYQQSNSGVIGNRIGNNDFIDKAIVGQCVHALRA